jgi:fatty acid desaturase
MQKPQTRSDRAEIRALTAAVAWMLLVQLGCVLLWDSGWLTRQAALIHWLLVGVLSPALALWRMQLPAEAR